MKGFPMRSFPLATALALALSGAAFAGPSLDTNGNGPGVYDLESAPFLGFVAMTQGQTYTAQRSVEVDCTAAGNIVFTMADGSTRTRALTVGTTQFPYAVTSWTLPGSGAATVSGVYNAK